MTSDRHLSTVGSWRLFRGVVVGAAASGFATWAHLLAGGPLPAPALWLAVSVLVLAGSVFASRWSWRLPGLVTTMLLAQLAFHAAFASSGLASAPHPMRHAMTGVVGGPVAVHGTPDTALPDGQMFLLHVAAALVLAAVLRFGEGVLRSTVEVLGQRLVRTPHAELSGVPVFEAPVGTPRSMIRLTHEPALACGSRGPP